MKIFKIISLLTIFTIVMFSCKKDSPIDWEQELRGTAWSGDFLFTYPLGFTNTLQVVSLLLNADHTVTMYEIGGEHPGVWSVVDNKIKITFFDGKVLTATVSMDAWSDITNVTDNKWKIISLIRTEVPKPEALLNSSWDVKYSDGTIATIKFTTINKLNYSEARISNYSVDNPYSIFGAGIKSSNICFLFPGSYSYFILQKNSMKGFVYSSGSIGDCSLFTGTKK